MKELGSSLSSLDSSKGLEWCEKGQSEGAILVVNLRSYREKRNVLC